MFGSKVKRIALSLLVGLGMTVSAVQAASADTHSDLYVVRLKNPSTFLNCRENSNTSSRVITTYKEGVLLFVEGGAQQGIFHKVWYGDQECWVSQDFLKPLDTSSVKGLLRLGIYQVTATDLNKRTYASTSAPVAGSRLQRGTDVEVVGLAFDKNNQSWLQLSTGEFVVGDPRYFIWKDGRGNPTCNYFVQECD